MARAKPKKKDEPDFVGPPLIPGKPAFYRWIGYFDISDERIAEIKKSLTPEDLEMMRRFICFAAVMISPLPRSRRYFESSWRSQALLRPLTATGPSFSSTGPI